MDSILNSVKKVIGGDPTDNSFDTDLIMHINSIFGVLRQEGIGPESGFRITGDTEVWNDFTADDITLEMVKSLIYLRVRMIFDPPSSSLVAESFKEQIKEFETRLYFEKNYGGFDSNE